VWWAAILEREDVITGVVVAADNVALPVLGVTPGAEGGDRFLIEGNRLVGVLGLAARLVPGVPPTTTRLSCTVISPASRSTDVHLRPHTWPRRIPVVSSSRNKAANRSCRTEVRKARIWSGFQTSRRVRGRLGGLTLHAGLSAMYFQATASTSARSISAWILRTVLGARPGDVCLGVIPDL